MGIKHLIRIKEVFKDNPLKTFAPSYFTNVEQIEYSQVLLSLQYLWEDQKIVLTKKGRYMLKDGAKEIKERALQLE